MAVDAFSPQDRRLSRAIKAGGVISALVAAVLVLGGFAGFCAARTDQSVTPETGASTSVAPGSKIERSGIMIVHELLI